YMMAHSLSRLAHGLRPVAISRITHPRDQMSTAPARPGFSPLITSGDMYMGVPVIDLLGLVACTSAASVRPCRAITLAAPKSTYLMMPLWFSRMSRFASQSVSVTRSLGQNVPLTLGLDVAVRDASLVQIHQALQQLQRVKDDDLLVLDPPVL